MSKTKAVDKETKTLNEMVTEALYKPNAKGFICLICEHALIHPVTTACDHTFCNYCISLWKKHNPYCPVCMETMGELKPCMDINAEIENFFKTAEPGARKERKRVLASREQSEARAFVRFQEEVEASKTKRKSTAIIREAPVRTTPLPKVPGQLGKLMSDTVRLEKELDGVYSKILTVGTNLNAREDNLMMTKYSGGALLHSVQGPDSRPYTAPPQKSARRMPSQARMGSGKPLKAISEIDDLLELTEDVLKIEDFLHRYSFERMLESEPALTEDDVKKFENAQILDELDSISIVKKGEVHPLPTSFRIHPSVQSYIEKNCSGKIAPVAPNSGRRYKGPDIGTSAREVKSRQSFAKSIVQEIAAVQALHGPEDEDERPPTPPPGGHQGPTELTNEVLKCRETLLNLRTQTQVQSLGGFSFNPSPQLSINNSESDLRSSRSCANVKLPNINLPRPPNSVRTVKKPPVPPPPPKPASSSKLLKQNSAGEIRVKKSRTPAPLVEVTVKKPEAGAPYKPEVQKQLKEESPLGRKEKVSRNKGAMGDCASSAGGENTDSTESSGIDRAEKSLTKVNQKVGIKSGRVAAAGDASINNTKEKRRVRTSSAQKPAPKKPSFK